MTETEENILDAAEHSYCNVEKAEWTGDATNYYCALLDCGHHLHCSRDTLRGRMLCMTCLTKKLYPKTDELHAHSPSPEPDIDV